jgi:hypothetical protein
MRNGRQLIGLAAVLGIFAASARAQTTVASDDPKLIARMNQICLSAALTSGGIDKQTKGFCQCAAPIFARHMTPQSRERLLVQNRTDVRPDYDDPNATYDDILKACPPASP